jgi:hypothetical protein
VKAKPSTAWGGGSHPVGSVNVIPVGWCTTLNYYLSNIDPSEKWGRGRMVGIPDKWLPATLRGVPRYRDRCYLTGQYI